MSIHSIDNKSGPRPLPADALVRRVIEAVRGLRFGSVEIVVHDGRVVQLERREKFRLDRALDADGTD